MGSIRRNDCINFDKVKARCLRKGQLFEDRSFRANEEALGTDVSGVVWKRPKDICDDPQFAVEGSSRLDLHQGMKLGNCWFIAGAATLASKPDLLKKVIPPGQTFKDGEYAGIFRFQFWWYGEWKEVVIDDRLPVEARSGQLMHATNRAQPNEFWGPLLEKAYAKLHGSYQNLEGGKIQDALVDMTGGASEIVDLGKNKDNEDRVNLLYNVMFRLDKKNCLMGCSINGEPTVESTMKGFMRQHAYSITKLAKINVSGESERTKLIRVRNPYGPVHREWNGAWSEGSSEWDNVDEETKNRIELEIKRDGEFWMCLEDWKEHFNEVQICYLTPQSAIIDAAKKEWFMMSKSGQWVRGVSSGGTPDDITSKEYLTNPQYPVSLSEPDPDDEDGRCTMVVSLMKKHQRRSRFVTIGYRILKMIKEGNATRFSGDPDFKSLGYQREVCGQHHLDPGDYCIIPSTLNAGEEAEFYLRIVTEKNTDMGSIVLASALNMVIEDDIEEENDVDLKKISRIFSKHGGGDEMVDANELRKILKDVYKPGTMKSIQIFLSKLKRGNKRKRIKFAKSDCNVLVSFWGMEETGLVSKEEFIQMVKTLDNWQSIYTNHSSNGRLPTDKVDEAFTAARLKVNSCVVQKVAKLYGGKAREIEFEEFVSSLCKIMVSMDTYTADSGLTQTKWILDQLG